MDSRTHYIEEAYRKEYNQFLSSRFRTDLKMGYEVEDVLQDSVMRLLIKKDIKIDNSRHAAKLIAMLMKFQSLRNIDTDKKRGKKEDQIVLHSLAQLDDPRILRRIEAYPAIKTYESRINYLTDFQKRVINLYVSGAQLHEIANVMKRGYNSVNEAFKKAKKNLRYGLITRKVLAEETKTRGKFDKKTAEIVKMVQEGYSLDDIAQKVELTKSQCKNRKNAYVLSQKKKGIETYLDIRKRDKKIRNKLLK